MSVKAQFTSSKEIKSAPAQESWNSYSYLLLFFMTSWPLCVAAAKNSATGKYDFAITTSTLSIELVKCIIAGILSRAPLSRLLAFTRRSPVYAVPGVIYAINNNMIYLILQVMPTPPFMLLEKIKIITTALLFRTFLKRHLSRIQWISIALLFLGTSLQHVGALDTLDDLNAIGLVYVGILAVLSGTAATFSEYALKRDMAASLHEQNFALYFYSTVTCVASALYEDAGIFGHFFQGWSPATLLVVANGAAMGLTVSVIMKTQSSLAKVYINTMAMVLSTIISSAMGQYSVTVLFVYSASIVICATFLYYEKAAPAKPAVTPAPVVPIAASTKPPPVGYTRV